MSRREVERTQASAGSASAAGGSGAGGNSAAGTGGDCPLSVEFDVTFDTEGVAGPPNLCAPCGQPSLTLSFSNSLALDPAAPNCTALCDTCQIPTCHGLIECGTRLASAPYRTSWSGLYYESGACDSGTGSQSCKTPRCAPAGDYWAEFCSPFGTADGTDDVDACAVDTSRYHYCTTHGFSLPAQGPVSIVLPLHAL